MEQIDLIDLVFFGMATLSLAFAIWAVRAFTKRDKDNPVPLDDMPARYEDYEECFYNP